MHSIIPFNLTHELRAGKISLRDWCIKLIEISRKEHGEAIVQAIGDIAAAGPLARKAAESTANCSKEELKRIALKFQNSGYATQDDNGFDPLLVDLSNWLSLSRCTYENVRAMHGAENGTPYIKRVLPGGGCLPECTTQVDRGWVHSDNAYLLSSGACSCVLITSATGDSVAPPASWQPVANVDSESRPNSFLRYSPEGQLIGVNFDGNKEAKQAIKELKLKKKEFQLEKKEATNALAQLRANYRSAKIARGPAIRGSGFLMGTIKTMDRISRQSAAMSFDETVRLLEGEKNSIDGNIAEMDRVILQIERQILENPE